MNKPTYLIEASLEALKEVESSGVHIVEKHSDNLWRIFETDLYEAEEIISKF